MRLELDVGNTRLKWRLVTSSGDILKQGGQAVTGAVDSFGLEGIEFALLQRVLVSSVSSAETDKRLVAYLAARVGVDKVVVAEARAVMGGITLAYKNVSALGVDRCLAMMAAYATSSNGVCVIDCGSAVTVDYVSLGGGHEGGYILPGLALLKTSLSGGTANVSVPDVQQESFLPGRDTAACVGRGVNIMLRSSILSAIDVARELSIERVVFTGGDARFVLALCDLEYECVPDLVFDGLGLYAAEQGLL